MAECRIGAEEPQQVTTIAAALIGPALLLATVIFSIPPIAVSASEGAQTEMLVPLTAGRWCPASPLLPSTGGPLSPTDMQVPVQGQTSFIVGLSVMRVDARFDGTECNEDCRQKVSRVMAQSLNLWRHLCLRCGSGLLAFIVDGSWVYVDADVFHAWKQKATTLSERLLSAYAAVLRLNGATPAEGGHVVGTYVRIRIDHPLIKEICEAELGAFGSEWPGRLKAAGCLPGTARVPTLSINYAPRPACGKVSLIGCATPEKGVEINTSRFRYVEPAQDSSPFRPREFIFGNTNGREVDLHAALLHETGHFLGLDHLPDEFLPLTNLHPVMLETYFPDFCVSITETSMFNSAADADWKYRAKTCSGLEGPP